jgi:nitroreductase/NAD-dependent dihydropyrimidine dehydrogenase PreA subunit
MTQIDLANCIRCGMCVEECSSSVLVLGEDEAPWVKYPENCNSCGHCVAICPTGAVVHQGIPSELCSEVAAGPPSESVRNLLFSRRSVRVFADRPVSKELIEQLIGCGANAGTASNAQSEGFVVIQDKKALSDLNDLVLEAFWSGGLKYMGSSIGRALVKAMYGPEMALQMGKYYTIFKKRRDGELPAKSIFHNAPAVIVTHGLRKNPLAMTNAALATRNMEIMAIPMGLGTCWMGFLIVAAQRDKRIGKFLGLTPDRNVCAAITVGFPKRQYKKTIPRPERPLQWL